MYVAHLSAGARFCLFSASSTVCISTSWEEVSGGTDADESCDTKQTQKTTEKTKQKSTNNLKPTCKYHSSSDIHTFKYEIIRITFAIKPSTPRRNTRTYKNPPPPYPNPSTRDAALRIIPQRTVALRYIYFFLRTSENLAAERKAPLR